MTLNEYTEDVFRQLRQLMAEGLIRDYRIDHDGHTKKVYVTDQNGNESLFYADRYMIRGTPLPGDPHPPEVRKEILVFPPKKFVSLPRQKDAFDPPLDNMFLGTRRAV